MQPSPPPAPVDTSTLPTTVTTVATHGNPLLSVWVPVGIGVVALAACAGTVLLVVRHRRAGTRDATPQHRQAFVRAHAATAGATFGSLLLVVVAVLAAINSYAGYIPTTSALRSFLLGQQHVDLTRDDTARLALLRLGAGSTAAQRNSAWQSLDVSLSDRALGISARHVVVALPPGYALSNRRYPVAYLFGGFPGRPTDWFVSGHITQTLDALAALGRSPYYVLVAPDVNGGFFTDSETLDAVGGPKVETWVTRDVVAYTDSHFRTSPTRAARVLAGMSSGGFAALNVALRHQDEFGVSLALEPYGDPGDVTKRLLGGSINVLHANSPSYYAATEPLHRRLDFYLDDGSGADVGAVTSLASVLHQRGEPVLLRIEKGQQHTWREASAGLPYALSFAARALGDPAALLQTLPTTAFPVAGADPFARALSPDAAAQLRFKLGCDRLLATRLGTRRSIPRACAAFYHACTRGELDALPRRVTGILLADRCHPRRFGMRHAV